MKLLLLASLLLPTVTSLNVASHISDRPKESASCNPQIRQPTGYLFPQFVQGTVYFRNGTKRTAKLNYHFRHGGVQFVDAQADTLLVTGKHLIDHVEMGGRKFFLTDTYSDMELITSEAVRLAVRMQPQPAGNGLSHSGQHFSASAGNAASGLLISNQGGNFQWENNASGQAWTLKSTYFLVDRNRVAHRASRRAFMTVFARGKREVGRYLREHRVDFANADDLQQLLHFCNNLPSR